MNMDLNTQTVIIKKLDKRIKDGGVRVIDKFDTTDLELIADLRKNGRPGFIVEVRQTYVERTNLLSQKKFFERYDTPYHCSPSSESYFSM